MIPTAEIDAPVTSQDETDNPIRVFLVDDHQMVRVGLCTLLERLPDMTVAGKAGTAEECLEKMDSTDFDVALLDVRLPDRSGLELCGDIKGRFPDKHILFLTSYFSEQFLNQAMEAGAEGYLLKEIDSDKLAQSIRDAHQGTLKFDRTSAGLPLSSTESNEGEPKKGLRVLSKQELRVIELVANGMTNRQIAEAMGLSEKTVKNYLSNLMDKLQFTRRAQAAAFYAEQMRPPY